MQIKLPRYLDRAKIKAGLATLKRLPWILGERAFVFFMLMVVLAVLTGAAFSLKFLVLDQQQPPQPPENLPTFPERELEDIIETLNERAERFQAADFQDYPDFFFSPGK